MLRKGVQKRWVRYLHIKERHFRLLVKEPREVVGSGGAHIHAGIVKASKRKEDARVPESMALNFLVLAY